MSLKLAFGIVALIILCSGCCDDCDASSSGYCPESESPSLAQSETYLGAFSGTLEWLQIAQQADVTLDVDAEEVEGRREEDCTEVEGLLRLHSSDEHLAVMYDIGWFIANDQRPLPSSFSVALDAQALLAAGLAPDAAGIETREPSAEVRLEMESDGTWSLTVLIQTATEKLTLAAGALRKVT